MRTQMRLVALMVATFGSMLGLGTAQASADPAAVIAMPNCCVADTVGLGGSVFALDIPPAGTGSQQATLVRLDPTTNTISGTLDLPNGRSTGNQVNAQAMASGAGSVWVTAYFENEILRIDPQTMTVTAHIATGRSPDSIVYDGRSLWVALQNDRSVVRIDPTRNLVTQTVSVGSKDSTDGPYQVAFDGTQVLVSMPVSGRVARIDPTTGKVRYDRVGTAAACARIMPSPGGYWLDDTECSNSYYRWDAAYKRISAQVQPDPHGDFGAAVVGNYLYTAEFSCTDSGCSDGQLVKRDAVSGAALASVSVGDEAFIVQFAAGSFWIGDWDGSALLRVDYF